MVDYCAVVREGLKRIIERLPDFEVCGEAGDTIHAMRLLINKPDLITADISMDGSGGMELIRSIKSQSPHLPILVISMHDQAVYAERTLRVGANGYVMKCEPIEKIVEAMRCVIRKKTYVAGVIAERILNNLNGKNESRNRDDLLNSLSNRELEVFRLIGKGCKPMQISAQLNISVKTVETYYKQIEKKLNLANTQELVQRAIQRLQSAVV